MKNYARVREADPIAARMVLMHGLGSNEADMLGLASELLPSIEVTCLRASIPYGPGYGWFHVEWTKDGIQFDEDQYWDAVEGVARMLPSVGESLIVGGFSQGAMLTHGLMMKHPQLVANAVLLSGRGYSIPLPDYSGSVFQAHGLYDEVIPFADAEALRSSLAPLGKRLEFHAYPMAHSVCAPEVEDLNAWLAKIIQL
jgi:phospholipase/carboxylesterase